MGRPTTGETSSTAERGTMGLKVLFVTLEADTTDIIIYDTNQAGVGPVTITITHPIIVWTCLSERYSLGWFC